MLGDGPYFEGAFSIVDAVFGPVFRYFDVLETITVFGFFNGLTKVGAWREALARLMAGRCLDRTIATVPNCSVAQAPGPLAGTSNSGADIATQPARPPQ